MSAVRASLLPLVAALALPGPGRAATVRLEAGTDRVDLGPSLEVLEDREGTLRPEDLSSPEVAPRFVRGPRPPGGGLSLSTFWLRFEVLNAEAQAQEWVLRYGYPLVDRIDLYEPDGSGFSHRAGGLVVEPRDRTIVHAGASHDAPLRLGPGERRAVLLRASTRASLLVPPSLWRPEALARSHLLASLAVGVGLGLLLLLALLQLYAGLVLRMALALRAAAALGTFAALILSLSGIGPTLLWAGAASWWLRSVPVLGGAALAMGLLFTREFLQTRERDRPIDRLLSVMALLAAGAALLAVASRTAGVAANGGLLIPGFAAFVLAGARARRRDVHGSGPFLLAAATLLLFGSGVGLMLLGVVGPSLIAIVGVELGFVLAATTLTLALADRALLANRRARAMLEGEVASRTRALDEAVQRLRAEAAERRQALEALRESEERFRVAFDTSPDAITMTRLSDGVMVAVNQGFSQLAGWTREEAVGRSSLDLGLWVDPADRQRMADALRRGEAVRNLEYSFRFKDGRIGIGLLSAQLVQLRGESLTLGVTRDITDRKRVEAEHERLQDELRQAQKMEAIGRLAGGVAHDFNNLLTVIGTNANLSLMDLPPGDPSRTSFLDIRDATRRATELTRQLLAFGRRQVIEPRSIDLSRQVAGMQSMLRRLLGEDVELAFDLDASLPPVMADPSQAEQVVVNLAVNARDAVEAGGRITLATRLATVPEEASSTGRPAGRYGVLSVSDTGAGMTHEVQAHVFEPFFTTKRRGTGLGLSTVYGIARQHGGFVEVESETGRGSTFRVHFPVAVGAAVPAPLRAAETADLPRGTETVLLVEDEDAVRSATRALLERLGYRVFTARDGREAIDVTDGHEGPVDLVVTDVVMPRMNGRELAAELAARRPGLPVLFVSGYSQEVVARNGLLDPGITLLRKPYEPAELARAVRERLDVRARAEG